MLDSQYFPAKAARMDQYKFLWKGRDPKGERGAEEVIAANAQAAREQLTQAGWTELELVKDEVCSVSSENVDHDPEFEETSAADSIKYFEGKGPGFFAQWVRALWD